MKTVTAIGHLAVGKTFLDGQTVKTRIITDELQRQLGQKQVLTIDTHGGWKTLLKAPFQALLALKGSRNILIFPAQNGLRIYAPLLLFWRHFFKGRKLHYVVIGGWLPQFLTKRKSLAKALKKFDAIYVETGTMKKALEAQGFENVLVMPNCKKLTILSEDELVYPRGIPYRLCTFSRVMKEKGIETAVDVIGRVNERLGYTAFTLDIYGQIWEESREWFAELQTKFPAYVRYCGSVDADKSVEALKAYFALLFPTHFYTEGIPGTIIDAYAAGIPVISARWESYSDVIDEGKTGIGYEFDNMEQLEHILLNVVKNSDVVIGMKRACIERAANYVPATAIRVLVDVVQ